MNKSLKRENSVIIVLVIIGLIILLLPILLFLWLLFGNHSVVYEFSQPNENIVCVEIVNIDREKDIYEKNFDSIEVIATITEDMLQEFYDDFAALPCEKVSLDPPYGFDDEALLVHFKDGSFEFVDVLGGYYYDIPEDDWDSKYYWFEEELFEELIEKYIALSE